jgi:hypothetical protein
MLFFKKHPFKKTLALANPALARLAAGLGHSFGASRHSSWGVLPLSGPSFRGSRGLPVDKSLTPLISMSFYASRAFIA